MLTGESSNNQRALNLKSSINYNMSLSLQQNNQSNVQPLLTDGMKKPKIEERHLSTTTDAEFKRHKRNYDHIYMCKTFFLVLYII